MVLRLVSMFSSLKNIYLQTGLMLGTILSCRTSRRRCMVVPRLFWPMLNGFFIIVSSTMEVGDSECSKIL